MNTAILKYLIIIAAGLLMTACADNDVFSEEALESNIVVVTSISGPGDNGYNDQILAGVMEVVNNNDLNISLVHPASIDDAKTFFLSWKEHSASDPTLIVMAGSDYVDLVRENASGLDANKTVLLFENDGEGMPNGVKTFNINRYGVSYLAGCMAKDSPAVRIVLAMRGDATIEEAAQGFADGYNAHAVDGEVTIDNLAETVSGYAMPDSAYRLTSTFEEAFVYPLAGGSNNGIYKYTREASHSRLLVAGMDVDCAAYSMRVPFSVIINISQLVKQYISDWINGLTLPDKATYALEQGMADIMISDTFYKTLDSNDYYYADQDYWLSLYNQFKSEAIEKETAKYQ